MRPSKPPELKVVLPDPKDITFQVTSMGVDPVKREEFQQAAFAAAREGAARFPKLVKAILDQFRSTYPIGLMACFASYGLQVKLGNDGRESKALPGILQHHAEILQALLLTLPPDEWGAGLLIPPGVAALIETVPQLSEAFLYRRIVESEAVKNDREKLTVRSIQERVRLHTHGVRNWGYFGNVIRLSQDLYGSLDPAMIPHHGFGATDVIAIVRAVVSEFERRQKAHWDTLRTVARAPTAQRMAETYYRVVPELVGTAKEFLMGFPKGIPRETMLAAIMAHMDLRLDGTAIFKTVDVAGITDLTEEVVGAVLRALSFKPGALVEYSPEHIFLGNPVWDRPGIEYADNFFIPIPQMAFSHIHRVMDRLMKEAGALEALKDRRAKFLETEIETVFREALPDAAVSPGMKWKKDGQQFETDLLVTIDRVVLIVEAKSHRLTPEGLRGAPDRVKRHIRDMVLDPSIQSQRLEKAIRSARDGDLEAKKMVQGIGIDPDKADRVIRLTVTLDDFSVLSAAEGELKEAGWVPKDHALAPNVLISDLGCIIEILGDQLLLLHYLNERSYLQRTFNLFADELDYLGLYLATGFNLPDMRDDISMFAPTGMSAPIDRYYVGRDNGLKLPKPTMELRPLFRSILERITQVKPEGWTLIGFHLLSCADPAQQRAVERSLTRLRNHVRRNHRNPDHMRLLAINPPEERGARVIFYVFPEEHRSDYRRRMEGIAERVLNDDDLNACVVFGRGIDTWGRAFESVLLAERV